MSTAERIKDRHGFIPKHDGFDYMREHVRYLQGSYRAECEYFDYQMRQYQHDAAALREIGSRRAKTLDYLLGDIIEAKTRLPPYTTMHPDGYLVRHPVEHANRTTGGRRVSDEDEWHRWSGGEIDLANVPVAVRWRTGNEWKGLTWDFQWRWSTVEQPWDIVAYKVLTPPPIDETNLKQVTVH